eukprot:FR737425.1.p1 GENE.FR737425.1~~FR737425.1.p1  ORF type:complete len:213 (+),score=11.10 FR737425.1:55-693(+)
MHTLEGLLAKLVLTLCVGIKNGLRPPVLTMVRGAMMCCGVILLFTIAPQFVNKPSGFRPLPLKDWLGPSSMRGVLALRGAAGFAGLSFQYLAIARLPLGDSQAIFFSAPMIAQFLAWLVLGERLSGVTLSCTAAATAGTLLVARPAFLFGSDQALPVDGVVFAVAGAFSAASVMILIRRIGLGEVDWRVTLLYQTGSVLRRTAHIPDSGLIV